MSKSKGRDKLPDMLLATAEGKENCCVIKTISAADSFVLLGSSEEVIEKTGCDGWLTSVVVRVPQELGRGLVGVVFRHALDAVCSSCEKQVTENSVLFISITNDRQGLKTRVVGSWNVPVLGVKFWIREDMHINITTPTGWFTTDFREAHEDGSKEIWYVSPKKVFCFLLRPSVEYLLEAAKALYFERLAVRRDDLLHELMEKIADQEKRAEEQRCYVVGVEEELERAKGSARDYERQFDKAEKKFALCIRNYERRLERAEKEFVTLEDELTVVCRALDTEYDVHMASEEKLFFENDRLSSLVEDLGVRVKQAERAYCLLERKLPDYHLDLLDEKDEEVA